MRRGRADPAGQVFATFPDWENLRDDLELAKIDRVDGLGRVLHLHAFRKTWQTMGVRYGINQRAAQEVLGHSDANLTAQVYTDVPALALHDEVAKLPCLTAEEKAPKVRTPVRTRGSKNRCFGRNPPPRRGDLRNGENHLC